MADSGPFVAVNPAQRFGRPNVKGISCEILGEIVAAGEDVNAVADEYGLTRADILVAAWYLGLYGSRRWRQLWRTWAESVGQAMSHASTMDYDTIPDPPVEARDV